MSYSNSSKKIIPKAIQNDSIEKELYLPDPRSISLLNDMNDGFFITDDSGRLKFLNNALVQMFGYDNSKDLINKNFIDLVDEQQKETILQRFSNAIQRGKSRGTLIPIKIRKKDGEECHIELKSTIIKSGGKILGSKGIIRDVTEKRKAEIKQKENQKFLMTILGAIDSLLIVIDKNFQIILSNWKAHEWVPEENRDDKLCCYKAMKNLDKPCKNCPAAKHSRMET